MRPEIIQISTNETPIGPSDGPSVGPIFRSPALRIDSSSQGAPLFRLEASGDAPAEVAELLPRTVRMPRIALSTERSERVVKGLSLSFFGLHVKNVDNSKLGFDHWCFWAIASP